MKAVIKKQNEFVIYCFFLMDNNNNNSIPVVDQ